MRVRNSLTKFKLNARLTLLTMLSMTIVSACVTSAALPGADIAAGIHQNVGFEFLRWDEGLAIMIWHDVLGESGSFSTSASRAGTAAPGYRLEGFAESPDGQRFEWHVQTDDGRTAEFRLAGRSFDLSNGQLFVVTMQGGTANVTQVQRNLSDVQPDTNSCIGFAKHDPILAKFLREHNESAESPPTPEASTSTASWVPYTNSVHRVTEAASAPLPTAEVPTVTSGPTCELSPTPQPQTPTSTPAPSPTLRFSPRVLSFSAEQVETEEGEGIGLTWEAEGEQATICPLIGESAVGCRCLFDVPLTGSHVVTPADVIGAYTGFKLIVEAGGVRAVRYTPLVVECPDRFSDWFFDDPPAICPREAPLSSYAAAQEFEHGRMIWIEAQDAYYILYDGFITPSGRQYISSKLTSLQILDGPLDLTPGASPGNRVGEVPPNGFFEPVSGFGLVWRGEVVGVEGVRARLGWAVKPEYGFDTIYQCEMSCGSTWDCYLEGPQGDTYHLTWLLHGSFGHFWEPVD